MFLCLLSSWSAWTEEGGFRTRSDHRWPHASHACVNAKLTHKCPLLFTLLQTVSTALLPATLLQPLKQACRWANMKAALTHPNAVSIWMHNTLRGDAWCGLLYGSTASWLLWYCNERKGKLCWCACYSTIWHVIASLSKMKNTGWEEREKSFFSVIYITEQSHWQVSAPFKWKTHRKIVITPSCLEYFEDF